MSYQLRSSLRRHQARNRAADHAKIDKVAECYREALSAPCTCYSQPEDPCHFCNLMTRARKLIEEVFPE